jgi:hypothetical protein
MFGAGRLKDGSGTALAIAQEPSTYYTNTYAAFE